MKATELMIGDWVYDSYHKANATVTTLTRALLWVSLKDNNHWQLKYDEVEPIPLTAEILKKNGFEEEHGYREIVYLYSNDFYNICIHLKERNYTNGAYTFANISHGCTFIEELPTNYVHELQHVMRLCKIKKEIEL